MLASWYPPIYCTMVTGKDASRLKFAAVAVRRFNEQTYPNKHLIVVNHGDTNVIRRPGPRITEIVVDKRPGVTLGDMRNVALALVPDGAYMLPYDDDDLVSPDYIFALYRAARAASADGAVLSSRVEVNLRARFAFVKTIPAGFYHALARKVRGVHYERRDQGEDRTYVERLKARGLRIAVVDNDPTMYMRTIHGTNTDAYIGKDQARNAGNLRVFGEYAERNLTPEQSRVVWAAMDKHFHWAMAPAPALAAQ